MGEVVNLRRARKRRARAETETAAAASRMAHGVSKSLKDRLEAERALANTRLDSHRRMERDDAD